VEKKHHEDLMICLLKQSWQVRTTWTYQW